MSIDYPALLTHLRERQDDMVAALAALVEQESPSTDLAYLEQMARQLADRFADLGAEAKTITAATGHPHLRILFPARRTAVEGRPKTALLLGHFDTVWPIGTIQDWPFRVEGDVARGPGVYDMKGGLVIAEFALWAIADLGLPLSRPVVLLLNSDEETGSATSRSLIEAEAEGAAYVYVLEPAMPDDALKTARKGVGGFTLEVQGRASHAGAAPEEGISAVEELARQILQLHEMSDLDAGTTVNVGVIEGGTRSNVVAARAQARIDVRAWTEAAAKQLEAKISALEPVNPETTLQIEGGFERMPLERTAAVVEMFETAQRIGRQMGLPLTEGASGGGSDGNFTAAMGVPTLDGLGAVGAGSHALREHVLIASLPQRAALLAGLLCEL